MTDVPPGGYPQGGQPQQPSYQPPPAAPQPPPYQPPPAAPSPPPGGYQAPPGAYQPAPGYQQPGQFQPVNPAPSSNNGCLKVFLIVMGISVVLGIIVVIGSLVLVGQAVDSVNKTFGVAEAKDYEIKIDDCAVDPDAIVGDMTAKGTFTNKSGRRQAYIIEVDFSNSSNTKIASDSFITTGALDDGQKYEFNASATSTGTPPDSISCKVAKVSYTLT